MSLESQVAELVNATNQLLNRVTTQADNWDAQVQAKINELEQWRQGVKEEYPGVNVHPNSRLVCSGPDENGLYIPDGYNYTASLIDLAELIPVRELVSNPDNDRHFIEKEFLDWAFGGHGNYLIFPNFNILHIRTKPKPAGSRWFMWRSITSVPRCTYRAFIKVLSGRLCITCAGIFDPTGEWRVIENYTGSNRCIWDEHRLDYTNNGEVLEYYFAYPQILFGRVSYPKSVVTIKQIQTAW
jgi:hypothetical protein